MKLQHNLPKGQRIFRNIFIWVHCESGYWWCHECKRWKYNGCKGHAYGNTFDDIRTVKAFRRRLREWSRYLPKGVEFKLVSAYTYTYDDEVETVYDVWVKGST